jgi:hypothetical protein
MDYRKFGVLIAWWVLPGAVEHGYKDPVRCDMWPHSQARSKDVSMVRVEMKMAKARGSEEVAPKLPLSLFHLLRPAARMHHGGVYTMLPDAKRTTMSS